MRFEFTSDQKAWRREVREFLRENFTEEVQEEIEEHGGMGQMGEGPKVEEFKQKVQDKGWYGLNWPEKYGGLEKSAIELFIFQEEFSYAGAPTPPLTVTSIGPTIIRHGTEENKKEWLPKIISGEVNCALGYSEPNAGTDLASLQTRAEPDVSEETTAELTDGEWVINGQKIWNSEAHVATHEWLAVRTDPDAPKHEGISIIMVPIDAPGISIEPLWTWGDVRTNQVFFDDVRVPRKNLIGELNKGWTYIRDALDYERIALSGHGAMKRAFDDLVEFCKHTVVDGRTLSSKPEVRRRLADLEMDLEICYLFTLETACLIDEDEAELEMEASITKTFSSELRTKLADWGMQILDMYGQLNEDDRTAPLAGRIERMYRRAPFLRFGGGTNEIQRNIIAQRGLGLPRP